MRLIFIFTHNGLQHGFSILKFRDLGQIPDIQAAPLHHRTLIRLLQACRDPKERGLSGSVDSDQADLFPLIDGKCRIVKQQTFGI